MEAGFIVSNSGDSCVCFVNRVCTSISLMEGVDVVVLVVAIARKTARLLCEEPYRKDSCYLVDLCCILMQVSSV